MSSAFKILQEGGTGKKGGKTDWRETMVNTEFDVIIIGVGGLGIETEY